ncbi:von Willebrand factor A domain-containing protein 7-like [Corticium candelabrum]|uniref:von Willebrand factor A domain-containing protein 7-like n=1 Tax=Corticium candelabrum TaxID=121492 RepID=UPI002E265B35|nr:von Willebrand factor A domain-containing protein 7-like [Corticium candelabrum]
MAVYLSVLVVCSQLCFVSAFMPNHVFSFPPPDGSSTKTLDVDLDLEVDDFYPVEAEGLVDNGYNHKDVIRYACLQEVARFYEETLEMDEGRLQRLEPLTAETLLTTVAERKASSLNFESALREIEVEAALMDVYYEVDDEDQATAIARQHFDNEKIKEGHEYLLEMAQTVFTLLRNDQSYSAARTFVGRFLLTLQDFYAHSNWIELENRDILTDLGLSQSPKFLSNIADPWTFTCTECCDPNDSRCSESTSPGGCTTCYDNVRKSKLTSGYFIYDNSQTKPTGKCSHGSKTDRSRHTSPTGGINKSTKICAKSPHHYLHDEAAHLAISASRHFLSHVRSTAGDEGFRKLFNLAERNNLESSTSLCFVMDQTGSMQNDIDAAKNRTRQIITSSTKPYNYVLVQFGDDDNDPAYGPAIVTNDAAEFLAELDKLKADGGGDCPELTLHALQLALTKCLPGPCIA